VGAPTAELVQDTPPQLKIGIAIANTLASMASNFTATNGVHSNTNILAGSSMHF